jgi:hypothetical protein
METYLGEDLVTSYCSLEVITILLKSPPLLERYLNMKVMLYMYTACGGDFINLKSGSA